MSQTVFDILIDGRPRETLGERRSATEEQYLSVRDHLQRLLNSRRGSLTHLPHYGMPDIAALYLGLPYSRDKIMACIRQCLCDFEPRLSNPHIRPLALGEDKDVTSFEIVGEPPQGRHFRYIVSLYRNGSIEVTTTGEALRHG